MGRFQFKEMKQRDESQVWTQLPRENNLMTEDMSGSNGPTK
jgi:hypothetical protein